MRRIGIAALGPKPRTRKPAPAHTIFPYLLRDMTVERPNQVWAADITLYGTFGVKFFPGARHSFFRVKR
jgi:transposase InsO family protein